MIRKNNGIVIVRIEFKNDIDLEDAERIAEKKTDKILKGLIFTGGIQIHGIEQTLHNFARSKSGICDLSMSLTVPFKFKATQLDELKLFIRTDKSDHIYYDLYRQAVNHNDDLGKFMFLYSLLMLVTRAKDQLEVDKFIIEERPEEEEFKKRSTKLNKRGERSRRFETRFTWLRNQVGHTQENSEITEVINKMKNCYKELQEIVKIAIEKFI